MVREIAAVSSLGLTVALVLTQPRIGHRIRVGPALAAAAGVVPMLAFGVIHASDTVDAAELLWRPLLAISSIMITAAAAAQLGVVDRLAATVFPRARGSASRLFLLVFALSALTSAVLNNDSAVLLLTPLVVVLIRVLYPQRPKLVVPFAFAVFMAAGVAPLVTANPMNLIVADYAGIDFNHYALRMFPISVAGWAVTYAVLRYLFRRDLQAAHDDEAIVPPPREWTWGERQGLVLVLAVLGAYPVVSYFGGSVWIVAATGAVLAVVLCSIHRAVSPRELVVSGVSWEILVFLLGVFTLAIGLRNAGVVEWLTELYTGANVFVIGTASALGSALINNHSMALTNLLAIDAAPGSGQHEFLAALIGGDLGPRLLPIGSLAGLLWLASLRRLQVEVSLRQFVAVGVTVTIPSLALSLLLLAAY